MPEFADSLWLLTLLLLPGLVWLRLRFGAPEDRFKRVAGTTLRLVTLAALVLALAGPLEQRDSAGVDLMFVLDVSSSLDRETQDQALAFVNRALMSEASAGRMGLVVFGADAAVEVLLGGSGEPLGAISTHVERGGTDIARAIEVAAGAFPATGSRRIVLLSDGRENLGRARAAARTARSIGIRIFSIPLANARGGDEVYVEHLAAPRRVREHEPFEVQMTLHSETHSDAHLVLMRDGAVLHDTQVALQPGSNTFTVVDEAPEAGLYEYEAVVNSDHDGVHENNRYQAFVQVRGAPRVLHAYGDAEPQPHLGAALRAQGLAVDEQPAHALPATMHALGEYDLVILDNVSGFDLSLEKMQLLEDYVRAAGGGLVTIGGDRSYAAGGYYDTPIERALPVTMDVKTEVKIPSLAVVIALDKSASMAEEVQGGAKLDIAKIAALSAVEVLGPLDRIGVLAFDTSSQWSVPPTEVGNRRGIADNLRTLRAGGSTDLYQALREAYRGLREQEAKVKHLIVLSDGLTDTREDFDALAAAIADDGITASTVTVGSHADRELMQRIAALGKGRHYHTEDMRDVPRIFTSDTLVASRDLFVERPTQPRLGYPGEILKGFQADALPSLGGYQRTYAKPAAQVLLLGPERDPLLVSWRYGLGKSVAFMSDLGGRWGRDWVQWPEFGRLVAQLARWTMRRNGNETLLPSFAWQAGSGEMNVDVLDADQRFINGLDMQATISGPDRASGRVALEQVAPGRYRGEFPVAQAGRYYMTVSGTDGELQVGPQTFGLAVPYSSEYLDLGVDERHLEDLAEATGGRMLPLSAASLAIVAETAANDARQGQRLWWPLVLGALLALLLEVAARKLDLPAAWRRHRQRRGAAARSAAEPGYAELDAAMTRVREQHIAAARDEMFYDPHDPAARARLYHAGGRGARR